MGGGKGRRLQVVEKEMNSQSAFPLEARGRGEGAQLMEGRVRIGELCHRARVRKRYERIARERESIPLSPRLPLGSPHRTLYVYWHREVVGESCERGGGG